MISVAKPLLAAFTSVIAFGLWKSFQIVYCQITSPIRHLRGPDGTSWISGNMQDVFAANPVLQDEWVKQYGSTLKFKGLFNSNWLFTADTRAISHVLTHTNDYHKPPDVRYNLSQIIGEGVVFVEGAEHRQQRHIMNPAFGPAHIRTLTDTFFAKAMQLRDILSTEIAQDSGGSTTGTRLDVMPWLNRMTLDVIGLAGFNYNIDALSANEKPNELNEAFTIQTAALQRLTILSLLQASFPLFRLIPSKRARRIQAAQHTIARIGKELLSRAKSAALEAATEKGRIKKNSLEGRDLFSFLVKYNMATDIPENERLSDGDVLAQVPTFLFAGHGTMSMATTWALYAITKAREIQIKLREELLSVDTDTPSMDELGSLPYLDAVVRETLRVHPPVPNSLRIAMKDDMLPVEKPYTDKNGVVHKSIRVNKGDKIFIPILAVNRSEGLWGPDAHEFKPERWQNVPEAVSQIPGAWSHLLTFLGGSRACIGYRFSIVETKAILFTLVRAFEFELAIPHNEIGKKTRIVQSPILRSDPEGKPQLPLLLKPYTQI